jgi:murein DD-endopeptidase MepM/ murein hydrolase activator NlpD
MKLKLTEQQVRGLIKNLTEQEMDFEKEAPNLSKFAKFISGTQSANTTQLPVSDEPQFAPDIPDGDDMMHPLGHKSGVSSNFGVRNSSIGSSNHKGIDIPTASNSPVYAPLDGIVSSSRDTTPNACGGFIKLDHSMMTTKFCHLSRMVVQSGQKVKKGQIIGYSGGGKTDPHPGTSTGPHLHYEILNKSGIAMNPSSVQPNLA